MWDKALRDRSYPPPLIIPSLTQPQLHWPPSCSLIMVGRSHLTACSRCLECSSPRCLHGTPLTSLKPFSNATFSGGLLGALYVILHAHSHTPDTLPTSSLFFLFINWHLSPSTTLLSLLNYVPCLLSVSSYRRVRSTKTGSLFCSLICPKHFEKNLVFSRFSINVF